MTRKGKWLLGILAAVAAAGILCAVLGLGFSGSDLREVRILTDEGWEKATVPAERLPSDWDDDFRPKAIVFVPESIAAEALDFSPEQMRSRLRLWHFTILDHSFYAVKVPEEEFQESAWWGVYPVRFKKRDQDVGKYLLCPSQISALGDAAEGCVPKEVVNEALKELLETEN